MSHPAWVCGLKRAIATLSSLRAVTPCVGVWIETRSIKGIKITHNVTPCVGVWIETDQMAAQFGIKGHTLRGCVDWNSYVWRISWWWFESHPAWVCGLKHKNLIVEISVYGHTLRGCVDWNRIKKNLCFLCRVTPCVGVWIETYSIPVLMINIIRVTPCVGVWIETLILITLDQPPI